MALLDTPRPPDKSLYRELRDGSAGTATRLVVSLAVGLLLIGAALLGSYILSALFYDPPNYGGRSRGSYYVRVREEMMALSFISASIVYVTTLLWIWSRHSRRRAVWVAAARTMGIWILTILLGMAIDQWFSGEDEFLIAAVCLAAGAATLILWVQVARRYTRGRALYAEDGVLDIRCPECGYRMVGLSESRCPECGHQYTLDGLLAQQNFDALRGVPTTPAAPPPAPPATPPPLTPPEAPARDPLA